MIHMTCTKLGLLGFAAALSAVVVFAPQAQAAPAATKATASSSAASSSADNRKARSAACSAEADKKGLHGKERKKFRSKCKRQGTD